MFIALSILFFENLAKQRENASYLCRSITVITLPEAKTQKPRILIVEDEKEIADTLIYALSSEGFEPTWLSRSQPALKELAEKSYDFGIFDIGLPDGNGFELLKKLRASGSDIPVLFLTARNEEIDRIVGLEIGADDYVVKPFSPREVVARVKVILKRVATTSASISAPTEQTSEGIKPIFEHRPEQRTIFYQHIALDLTRAEYALLAYLMEQPGRVFSRRQLIEAIWSNNHPSDDRAIDTHIKTLRSKLKTQNPHQEFITTHRGFGYSLTV